MNKSCPLYCYVLASCSLLFGLYEGHANESPSYTDDIGPILTKYCTGCHNADDWEGELALDSFTSLMKGGETGPIITPGNASSSRILGVLRGTLEPTMPPEGEVAPTTEEIALLEAWIESGANGPSGKGPWKPELNTPHLPPVEGSAAITCLAFSPQGDALAIGSFGRVAFESIEETRLFGSVLPHPGKVQSVCYSADGQFVITASGITGLYGEAKIWNVNDGTLHATLPADTGSHRDILYAAVPSPDGRWLATAGYDRTILLWDIESKRLIRKFGGHHGAIYDLSFSPDGTVLASASADATVKVWHVESGIRLDTRSEPLKEQYTTAISPNGKLLVAGGEDSRIRVWQLISTDQPKNNPLLFTRFAHEGALNLLRFSEDGRLLVTTGVDGNVKLWETENFQQVHSWSEQPAPVQALSISSLCGEVAVGRIDGSVERYPLPRHLHAKNKIRRKQIPVAPSWVSAGPSSQLIEIEPNDTPGQAQVVQLPVHMKGLIHCPTAADGKDIDLFRFSSQAGQRWIFEVVAARKKSMLDSHLEILDSQGHPIPRVVLQATYESYFTFRGKDSNQTGDYRLHNWEDLRLNQYLYCNGEVVRFYHYPRGPDSGFNVYPDFDKRHAYFGTTPLTHPLNETCYVVEPNAPGTPLVANGLPTFTINYENDDDSLRRYGDDSYLSFITPADGEYLVRVSDVRGSGRSDFSYELVVRPPQPDFAIVSIAQEKGHVMAGSGMKFGVTIERNDGFDGPVTIQIEGLPAGFKATAPLIVQAGQLRAYGTIFAEPDAIAPTEEESIQTRLIAVAQIDGREIRKWPYDFGKLTLKPAGELQVELAPHQDNPALKDGLPVIEITAGTTTTFIVRAIRNGYTGRVSFGDQGSAYNAPHGVYVDNIGLKGMQLQEDENQRIAFLTAEPWVEPQERMIFVEAEEAGRPASKPVWLRVLPPDRLVQATTGHPNE